jgi:hypothetical protein
VSYNSVIQFAQKSVICSNATWCKRQKATARMVPRGSTKRQNL